jgi:predicted dehydrogenase
MPLEIYGERGSIEMDGFDGIKIYSDDQPTWLSGSGEVLLRPKAKMPGPPPGGLQAAVAHLVDCIVNDREPETSGVDARKSLELAIAAYRAAETGQTIKLPL